MIDLPIKDVRKVTVNGKPAGNLLVALRANADIKMSDMILILESLWSERKEALQTHAQEYFASCEAAKAECETVRKEMENLKVTHATELESMRSQMQADLDTKETQVNELEASVKRQDQLIAAYVPGGVQECQRRAAKDRKLALEKALEKANKELESIS